MASNTRAGFSADNSFAKEQAASWFSVTPLPECKVSVVVPVRDEAASLNQALRALIAQVDSRGRRLNPKAFEIIVLANNCADDSANIARAWQTKSKTPIFVREIEFPIAQANVGTARKTVMDAAFWRAKKSNRRNHIVASTDGDTTVAPDWIAATLHEFARGADAVGGRISIDKRELAALDCATRALHLRDVGYRAAVAELESRLAPLAHDPFPRHHQHFNASFAVTAAAYERAGGVPQVECLEDIEFYRSLLRVDARFRHSPLVRATTSARRAGRTARGLSTQLAEWSALGEKRETYLVEGLTELETKFRAARDLRDLRRAAWLNPALNQTKLNAAAKAFAVSLEWLREEILRLTTFGELFERVERASFETGEWRARFPLVDIKVALSDLRRRLAPLRALDVTNARKHRADIVCRAPLAAISAGSTFAF